MKKIYSKLLNGLFSIMPGVIKAISYLSEDAQERFIDICLGCEITIDELPKKIKANGVIYTLDSCNYLNDDIKAFYIDTDVRYFATKNEAIEYSNSGKFNYAESRNKETAEYPYKGKCSRKIWSYFTFNTWMNSEIVK